MGIKYSQNVTEHIKQLFKDSAVVENSDLLLPSPFKSLFLPVEKLAFHLVALQAPYLNTLESTFFYDWANHAEEQGLQPIHIWEDKWLNQKEIILSQLSSLAKNTETIFARNTVAKRITQPQANAFLNQHHLNGSPNARYKFGLFSKKTDSLVAVATFSAPRKFVRDDNIYRSFELIRYGSQINTTITGGLSKLLKAFIEDVEPDDIMTYTDRDWWTGKSYMPLGFKKTELVAPITFWLKPTENVRYTKQQLLSFYKKELNKDKPDNLNYWFAQKGYIKIYNSGSNKFLLSFK